MILFVALFLLTGSPSRVASDAIAAGRFAEAEAVLERALRADPNWSEGLWLLGVARYQAERYPAAREALERLIALDPRGGAPHALLGLCHFELRNYGAALAALERGRALGIPDRLNLDAPVRWHLALSYLLAERWGEALRLLDGNGPDVQLARGLAVRRISMLPAQAREVPGNFAAELLRAGAMQPSEPR